MTQDVELTFVSAVGADYDHVRDERGCKSKRGQQLAAHINARKRIRKEIPTTFTWIKKYVHSTEF